MSKSRMRGHFRYLRFKTFPMTPRTFQCEVFWSSKSSSEFSGVSEDSNPNFFQVLGFTPTLGQSRVATQTYTNQTSWLVHSYNIFGAQTSHRQTWIHKSHHLPPYSILCVWPQGLHPNVILFWDSQVGDFETSTLSTL